MGTDSEMIPDVTLNKIPEILKPIEEMGFEQLKAKLDTVGETSTDRITSTHLLMSWSTVIGTLIIIVLIILVVQALMRCRKLRLQHKVLASALLGETGEPMSVLFEKNAEKIEVKPSVGIDRQSLHGNDLF